MDKQPEQGQTDSSQTEPVPAIVDAPEGSRADAVSTGANSNFGPLLSEVPHAQPIPPEAKTDKS